MKIFEGKSPAERNKIIAAIVIGVLALLALGNLIFAPLFDSIGARWLLIGGAFWALLLSRWCNIESLDRSAQEASDQALEPDHAASFDEHGYSAGE